MDKKKNVKLVNLNFLFLTVVAIFTIIIILSVSTFYTAVVTLPLCLMLPLQPRPLSFYHQNKTDCHPWHCLPSAQQNILIEASFSHNMSEVMELP